MNARVLQSINEVSRDAWNALAGDLVPFVRWEWIHALESSGSATQETGWEPAHLTLWSGKQLVGCAPAWRKHHSYGEYVYDFAWAGAAERLGIDYYPKLLVGVPLAPITAPRFLGEGRETLVEHALAHAKKTECSSLHVIFPGDAEAGALEELGLARRVGLQYHWKNPGYRDYDEFLARFSAKRRHQLKRERAEVAKRAITIRTVTRPEPKLGDLAAKFYETTARKNGWGHAQLTREFFWRVFEAFPESVELVLAERAGNVIAGAFNVSHADRLYGRYWGAFEDVPFLHFDVCLYHSIDDCIRRGKRVFEPGAGGEHKIARGFEPTAVHSAHRVFDARLERAIREFVLREAEHYQSAVENSEEIAGMRPWPIQAGGA